MAAEDIPLASEVPIIERAPHADMHEQCLAAARAGEPHSTEERLTTWTNPLTDPQTGLVHEVTTWDYLARGDEDFTASPLCWVRVSDGQDRRATYEICPEAFFLISSDSWLPAEDVYASLERALVSATAQS